LTLLASMSATNVPDWIPVAALIAGAVSLGGLGLNRLWDRRDRRRSLYADAYQAALSWEEMLYRVRRRDPEGTYALAERFHAVQERIDFHQGWIAGESIPFGRAYCRLVLTIKSHTREPIRLAWASAPVKPGEGGFPVTPIDASELQAARDRFIDDHRDHLSFQPWRRRRLARRYDDASWAKINKDLGQIGPQRGE
jgi:hypothetical protein